MLVVHHQGTFLCFLEFLEHTADRETPRNEVPYYTRWGKGVSIVKKPESTSRLSGLHAAKANERSSAITCQAFEDTICYYSNIGGIYEVKGRNIGTRFWYSRYSLPNSRTRSRSSSTVPTMIQIVQRTLNNNLSAVRSGDAQSIIKTKK